MIWTMRSGDLVKMMYINDDNDDVYVYGGDDNDDKYDDDQ